MKKVFISYSHKDEKWKDRLVTHLKAFVHQGDIVLWDDRKIDTGQDWFPEIEAAMADADIAICLISKHYLSSDFINKEEIPELKKRRKEEGMLLMPLLLSPCTWEAIKWLKGIQMFPRDSMSLEEIKQKVKQEKKLTEFALDIHERIEAKDFATPVTAPTSAAPEKLDIDRLPETGVQLFGRKKDLQLLDEMWDTGSSNVISFVAWGGVGKSTLVNQWLDYMKADNYCGAKKVFGWSFYSQGTSERVTSADKFISEALEWFGDKDPKKGSPWDKGQRLADLVRKEKTLLILDGLEPLQSGYDFEKGKIKDPALSILVTQLARDNNGLCVITTREKVAELTRFNKSTLQPNLEQISKEAGRALLRVGDIQGTDAELEAASEEFGNHALAVNLLASYIHDIPGHHISNAKEIPDLDIPEEKGRHPRRVIAAFEKRFGEGPKIQLLRVMGLFDRPAHVDAVKAVRKSSKISGLTDKIKNLSEGKWLNLLEGLRELKLLAPKSEHNPDIIDCHPLVREHFGEKLSKDKPEAWKEAHSRLYEYYKGVPEKELPDTLAEMEPLYAAVTHGCLAGRHQETLDDVYGKRISRREKSYSLKQLGAIGVDLAAVSCFFEEPWNQPASDLTERYKSLVLSCAGYRLRALGRLTEAAEPMEASLTLSVKQEIWKGAARNAGNLSELYLTLGDVKKAVKYARKGVEFADRSGESFEKMVYINGLANMLHQDGKLSEAKNLFHESEGIQKKRGSDYPYLYSLQGFQFCDLLL
ncbi:toll/interleukin-1 receptor domain-containing protein, partial [bacterium]|nr:toll/interleukin-1 receptor domain-containing protein [bacterium]